MATFIVKRSIWNSFFNHGTILWVPLPHVVGTEWEWRPSKALTQIRSLRSRDWRAKPQFVSDWKYWNRPNLHSAFEFNLPKEHYCQFRAEEQCCDREDQNCYTVAGCFCDEACFTTYGDCCQDHFVSCYDKLGLCLEDVDGIQALFPIRSNHLF